MASTTTATAKAASYVASTPASMAPATTTVAASTAAMPGQRRPGDADPEPPGVPLGPPRGVGLPGLRTDELLQAR